MARTHDGVGIAVGFMGLLILLAFAALCGGCIPSTTQLAGFTQSAPAIKGEWGLFRKGFEIGTNFTGDASMTRDAETGEIQTFTVNIISDAGSIYDAQGRRVITADLAGLRRDNYEFQLAAVEKIGATILGLADRATSLIGIGKAVGDPGMVQAGQSLLGQLGPLIEALRVAGLGPTTNFPSPPGPSPPP